MRGAVDQLIELIRFAGVIVAFVGVVVTVIRAAIGSLVTRRSRRVTEAGLDLARIVLVAIDLMLVSAILEVAINANEVTFTRLAVVAGLRIGLTLLLAFEDAFRADTAEGGDAGAPARAALSWPGVPRRRDRRTAGQGRLAPGERPGDNVWPDRARLGRDWHRSAG
ncbi:MAG TPA: hypothetical protein VEG38_21400 [Acidimicrobiia bacterium]|nr:hypothetical protein [Acidimicrobiia bacterium]